MDTMQYQSIGFFKQQLRNSVSVMRMLEYDGRSLGLANDHRLGYHQEMYPPASCPLCQARREGPGEHLEADGPPPPLPALAVMPQYEMLLTALNASIEMTKHLLVAYEKSAYVNMMATQHRLTNRHNGHPLRDCPLCTIKEEDEVNANGKCSLRNGENEEAKADKSVPQVPK